MKLNNFLHKKETQAFQKAKIQNSTKESKQIFFDANVTRTALAMLL